jgi:superfamily II DNA or RNA helicase
MNQQTEIYLKFSKSRMSRLKMESNDPGLIAYIKSKFTVPNPNFRFQPHADKNLSPISLINTFNSGLCLDLIKVAKEKNPYVVVDISEVRDIIRPFSFMPEKILPLDNPDIIYRDYQEGGIRLALKFGRGTFAMATASGKSALMWGLIKNIWHNQGFKSKVLILVPGIQLVKQMYSDFINYGCLEEDLTRFSSEKDNEYNLNHNIIITNRAWLSGHQEELPEIDLLLIDEAHQLSNSNEISKIVNKFPTYKRFGFSGTIPDQNSNEDKEKLWNIIGICGMILAEKKSVELQKEGYIAKSKFLSIRFNHNHPQPMPEEEITDPFVLAKAMYPLELNYIENCDFTNNFICKFVYNLPNNSIMLFDHTEHGFKMKEILEKFNNTLGKRELFFINGEIEVNYRESVRARLEEINNGILLANTACFSTGINIKNIHNIIFCFASGSALSKVIQSIGRGLRIHESKEKLLIIDFYHSFKYSVRHYIKRIKLYKENYELDKIDQKILEVTR